MYTWVTAREILAVHGSQHAQVNYCRWLTQAELVKCLYESPVIEKGDQEVVFNTPTPKLFAAQGTLAIKKPQNGSKNSMDVGCSLYQHLRQGVCVPINLSVILVKNIFACWV